MIRGLDHIGIAVKNLEEALQTYETALGMVCQHRETVAEQEVKTAFLPLGDTRLELLESLTPEGPIGRFIAKRGEGIHHLCFRVDDIQAAMVQAQEAGMALIDKEPRRGADQKWIAFLHPKSANGVLIELSQASEAPD